MTTVNSILVVIGIILATVIIGVLTNWIGGKPTGLRSELVWLGLVAAVIALAGMTLYQQGAFRHKGSSGAGEGGAAAKTPTAHPATASSTPHPPLSASMAVIANEIGSDIFAADRTHLWFTSQGDDSVIEVDAKTGVHIRTLTGDGYGFGAGGNGSNLGISAILDDGTFVWVAVESISPTGGGALTEINASNGTLVRVITDPADRDFNPSDLYFDGSHLWAASVHTGAISEVNPASASIVREFDGVFDSSNSGSNAFTFAVDGPYVWTLLAGSLAQFDPVSGHALRKMSVGQSYYHILPVGSSNFWLTGNAGISEELNSNGTVLRRVNGIPDGDIVTDGSHFWVATDFPTEKTDTVTEFDASTGASLHVFDVFNGSRYRSSTSPRIAIANSRIWAFDLNSGDVIELPAV